MGKVRKVFYVSSANVENQHTRWDHHEASLEIDFLITDDAIINKIHQNSLEKDWVVNSLSIITTREKVSFVICEQQSTSTQSDRFASTYSTVSKTMLKIQKIP